MAVHLCLKMATKRLKAKVCKTENKHRITRKLIANPSFSDGGVDPFLKGIFNQISNEMKDNSLQRK